MTPMGNTVVKHITMTDRELKAFAGGPGPTAWGGTAGPEGHLVSRLIAAHNSLLSA